MKYITDINEGKKRLKLLISSLVAIIVYISLVVKDWNVKIIEALIEYPLISIIGFGTTFILLTTIYWVLDGFDKGKVDKIDVKELTALKLFEIADGASLEFQGKLISMSGITKTGNEKLDNINEIIIRSWEQPALAYTFGLTCACMLKKQKTFLHSSRAKDFAEIVSDRLCYLVNKENSQLIDKATDPIKAKEYSDAQVKKIIQAVLFFYEQMLNDKKTDPLHSLNNYVVDITGLKEPTHFKQMSIAGKTLLGKINKLLV